jgi:hypothetical protein
MDGKLDPSFNTGAELRKHLRDPRQMDVGRKRVTHVQASGPAGMVSRVLTISVITTGIVSAGIALAAQSMPKDQAFDESSALILISVGAGAIAGLLFIAIKSRAILMENALGTRSPGKARDSYANPDPMPTDCGIDDWLSQDVRFVVRTFFASAIAGIAIAVLLIAILLACLPESITTDREWVRAIVQGGGTLLAIALQQVIWRFAESRHPRAID